MNEFFTSFNTLHIFSGSIKMTLHPDNIIAQIKHLKDLKEGWDYGDGDVISEKVIISAIEMYRQTLPYSLKCTVHPTSDGGITLVLSAKETFLDITIQEDLTILLTKEQGIGCNYTTLYSDKLVSKFELMLEIKKLSIENCIECISSEPFTLKSTFPERKDFKVIASNQMEMGFQYLNMPVH